jgi:hypothetical protein
MAKEADDHLGSALQAGELKTRQPVQVGDGSGQRILHRPLDERIALLIGWGHSREASFNSSLCAMGWIRT